MKKITSYVFALMAIVLTSCAYEGGKSDGTSLEEAYLTDEKSGESGGSSDENGQNGQAQPGVITAGEWNDLSNWSFWN
ncbi:MAG: hypothetical protein LBG77_06200, partial [Dysgonamonadaceae bacterium]|nr:hypothetical protein [Dysgonamonadaceae bacterium]